MLVRVPLEIKDILELLKPGEELRISKCLEMDAVDITVNKVINDRLVGVTTKISCLELIHIREDNLPYFYKCTIVDKLNELRERAK
jgi:hypothetical protein